MHHYNYDLERFSDRLSEYMEDGGSTPILPTDFALEEAEHIINVAIMLWIEALCVHEVGQDWIFAPSHIYASFQQDLEESGGRIQEWLVMFFQTMLFADESDEKLVAEFGLRILRKLDPKGDIMVQSVCLTTPDALDAPADDILYQRIVKAAQSHAVGNSAIMLLVDALDLATSSGH